MTETDWILDDLFHGCAFQAFVEQARIEQGPPDSEATSRRAYRLYEDALAEKNTYVRTSHVEHSRHRTPHGTSVT